MTRTDITTTSYTEQRQVERKLKETGYTKTNGCMWVKIYTKGNNEVVVNREW